jgi:hypothetical protein
VIRLVHRGAKVVFEVWFRDVPLGFQVGLDTFCSGSDAVSHPCYACGVLSMWVGPVSFERVEGWW